MSSIFSKPKSPKLPVQEQVEEVQTIKEDETQVQQRERKALSMMSGRQSTMLAGLQSALKRRLGE